MYRSVTIEKSVPRNSYQLLGYYCSPCAYKGPDHGNKEHKLNEHSGLRIMNFPSVRLQVEKTQVDRHAKG